MCEKRLEKIEKDKAMSNDDVVIKEDDYNWLIEQVEQNEQPNKKLSEVHSYLQEVNLVDDDVIYWGNNVIDVLSSYSKELKEQNKSYREALEFGVKYLKNSDIKQVQLVVTKPIITKEQADFFSRFMNHELTKGLSQGEIWKCLVGDYEIEPEFKVGDIVKDGNDTLREVAEVKENGICLYVNNEITPLGWIGNNSDMYKQLRHATPKEIAEEKRRRWFAKHDREVGELRSGDLVRFNHCNYTIEKVYGNEVYVKESSVVYAKDLIFMNNNKPIICFRKDRLDNA